ADADARSVDGRVLVIFAGQKRGEIDKNLERGSGLSRGVDGSIELACAIVAAADDGPQQAVRFGDDRRRLMSVVSGGVVAKLVLDDAICSVLNALIEPGA